MKALVVLVAMTGLAGASPMIKPPAGWTGGADADLVRKTGLSDHFGGVHGVIEAERYDGPKPGIVLYVTRIAANVAAPDAAARAEIDSLHPSKLETTVVETHWDERFDAPRQQLEATETARDTTSQISTTSLILIAGTKDRLVAVRGDCLSAGDADAAIVEACKNALVSLDPGIDAKDRVVLALAPAGAAVPAAPSPAPSSLGSGAPASTLSDGSHVALPPMSIPRETPPSDRRPVVIGLGIAILAAMFWWNSRRRARFEREDEAEKQEPDDR